MSRFTFDASEIFGRGASRIAYLGTVRAAQSSDPFDVDDEVVVKVMQSEYYNNGIRLSKLDLRTQERAASIAKEFTKRKLIKCDNEPVAVAFRRTKLWTFGSDHYNSRGNKAIVKGELGLVERKINGKYEKFNSNSGWTAGVERADFFSHWSYWYTNGSELVCDLQGTNSYGTSTLTLGSKEYAQFLFLTDPTILSTEQKWGLTDCGQRAIENWFNQHTCGKLCKSRGLENCVPRSSSTLKVIRGTTYCP